MQQLGKEICVIKVGGDIVLDPILRENLAQNIKELKANNFDVILLHGGGPQVTRLQTQLGHKSQKVGGRRITLKQDLRTVTQAICGEVNVALVSTLLENGINAFGCHGASGQLIQAKKRPPVIVSGGGDTPIDFGEVGDVTQINHQLLKNLLKINLVPVIATLGVSDKGRIFNINADTTVVKIAQSLQAKSLILCTQVGGIFKDIKNPKSRIKKINTVEAKALITEGIIVDGMIPKVEEALTVFDYGVSNIAIVGVSSNDTFISALRQEGTYGTQIVNS